NALAAGGRVKDALVPVFLAKVFENIAPRAPRLSSESLERRFGGRRAIQIGHDQRVDGSGNGAFTTDLTSRYCLARKHGLICFHEFRRTRHPWQRYPLEPPPTEISTAITILMNVVEADARHFTTSHSFSPCAAEFCALSAPVTTSISPCGAILTRATWRPAAITALTARVRSRCRKVHGPRAIMSPAGSPRGAHSETASPRACPRCRGMTCTD